MFPHRFNVESCVYFSFLCCSDPHHNVSKAPAVSSLLAQPPLLYITRLTANHRLTATVTSLVLRKVKTTSGRAT